MNRLHVGIFGETNSGKSTLFNALTGTDIAIVSQIAGTTTDSVQKTMELVPFGPIMLIDTAGFGDDTELGKQRLKKTMQVLNRVDFALYMLSESDTFYEEFKKKEIPHILVSVNADIETLKKDLANRLADIKKRADSLLAGLLPQGATVLMVAPIDSAAPSGRLILPQAQLIRDCLDNGFMVSVVTEKEIETALASLKKIDLVVTDSQVFGFVDKIVPKDIMLTSFSILMARQKGNVDILIDGLRGIKNLKDNDKILVSEVCTHNRTHEDIGQVKIPAALSKITGCNLNFEFTAGRDFPEDLSQYSLVIHCGACMVTQKEMENRIINAKQANIPITNYGLFLAHASGILARSIKILEKSV